MPTIGVIHILMGCGSSVIKNSVEKRYRLQMEGDLENVWWVPLTWSMTLTKKYKRMCERYHNIHFCSAKNIQKIIPSDHKELLRSLVRFKDGMEGVMGYDHIQIPPVYKQVCNANFKKIELV